MSWNQAIYTSGGAALLTECLEGRVLTITRAAGAVGTYTEEELAVAATLTDETMSLGLLDITTVEDTGDGPGKKIGVQITNESLGEALELHQVGIFGVLDDEDSTEQLILILQDERGVEVPSEVENPNFEIDLYAVLAISPTARIELSIDADVRVTADKVAEMISDHNGDKNAHSVLFENHNKDETAHAVLFKTMLEQLKQATAKITATLSLTVDDWTANEDSDFYPYMNSAECSGATADLLPLVMLDENSEDAAFNCGLKPAAETGAGIVIFYAKSIPTTTITCTIALI